MKHIMSLTYKPKISRVLRGEIRKTMRKTRKFSIDDPILLHGWTGRPYRSPWSWRLNLKVCNVTNVHLCSEFIEIIRKVGHKINTQTIGWHGEYATWLAKTDGLEGKDGADPTGEDLREGLMKLNGKDWEGSYQIIEWHEPDPDQSLRAIRCYELGLSLRGEV